MPITIQQNVINVKNASEDTYHAASGYIVGSIANIQNAEREATTNIATAQSSAESALSVILGDKASPSEIKNMFAGTFSSSTSYTAGQYVIQPGNETTPINHLYKFTKPHAAGAWIGSDAVESDVDEIKLADEMSDLKENIVLAQAQAPAAENNRIWIPTTTDEQTEIEVPTYEEFSDLKSALDDTSDLLSDDATLLSDSLTDKTGQSSGVEYTLTGNTITASGTVEGTTAFIVLGSTTSPQPSWMQGGKKYVVSLTNSTPLEVRLRAKTTEQTSIFIFARFTKSGNYIVTIPQNITVFQLIVADANAGDVINGSITIEISNVIPSKKLLDKLDVIPENIFSTVYSIPNGTTALSAVLTSGEYRIPAASLSTFTDLPNYANIASSGVTFLTVYANGNNVIQILEKRNYGLRWTREILNGTVGDWAEQQIVRSLRHFGYDANSLGYNGFYGWGSTDAVTNVMPLSSVGLLYNAIRDANTSYQIGIRYYDNATYCRIKKSGVWGEWKQLAFISDIQQANAIKYISAASSYGGATEAIAIYVKASVGYIKYIIGHFINPETETDKNYNIWRIFHAYHVDDFDDTNEIDLTIDGEWECALHLDDRDDFSGGSTHGDEVLTEAPLLLIDGIPTDITTITTTREFQTVRFTRLSKMFDPADHTTMIANHGVEYVFDKNGMTINQSVIWRVVESLTNCFLCMFLPSKAVIDRASANSDFKILSLPSDTSTQMPTTYTKSNATAVDMWDTSSGASANISIPVYPTGLTGGGQISISDNDGRSYNKLYFKVCGGGQTTNGEMWKSTSIYKIDYKQS